MWMLSFIVVVLKTAVKGLVPLLACDYLANAATEFAFI